jgi:hypothetical protein
MGSDAAADPRRRLLGRPAPGERGLFPPDLAGHPALRPSLRAPGGPGALAPTVFDHLRADLFQRETATLVRLHGIEEVFLIFHGPAPDGPDEAVCADYRRKCPRASAAEIRKKQEEDARDVLGAGYAWRDRVKVRIFRCEVGPKHEIQFVRLPLGDA